MKRTLFVILLFFLSLFILCAEVNLREEIHSLFLEDSNGKRIISFALFLLVQMSLFFGISLIHRKLKKRIALLKETKLKSIRIHEYELLDPDKQVALLIYLADMQP